MAIAIVTENSILGDLLSSACAARSFVLLGIFSSCGSINSLGPNDTLLVHLCEEDAGKVRQLEDLAARVGQINIILLMPDRMNARRPALGHLVVSVVLESECADALLSILNLHELGYRVLARSVTPELAAGHSLDIGNVLPNHSRAAPLKASDVATVLSKSEAIILSHLQEGLSNKLIAKRMGISDTTVKVHLRSTFRKIGVSNRTQAAIWHSQNDRERALPPA